jgi:hypothetical protein
MIRDLPLSNVEHLLDQAWEFNRLMHSLVLTNKFTAAISQLHADATIMRSRDNTDLLERVKLLTARKRGPRPHKPVQAEPGIGAGVRRLA